jgi:hypothetical protein
MPAAGLPWLARSEVLSFEEIVRTTRILVEQCGVRTIRLTGGEPLVRKGIEDLTAMIAGIDPTLDMYSWSMLLGECAGIPEHTLSGLATLNDSPRGGIGNLIALYGATATHELPFVFRGTKP